MNKAIFFLFLFVININCSSCKQDNLSKDKKLDVKYQVFMKRYNYICSRQDRLQNIKDLTVLYQECNEYSDFLPPNPRPVLWLAGVPAYCWTAKQFAKERCLSYWLYFGAFYTAILFFYDANRIINKDENIEKQAQIKSLMKKINQQMLDDFRKGK